MQQTEQQEVLEVDYRPTLTPAPEVKKKPWEDPYNANVATRYIAIPGAKHELQGGATYKVGDTGNLIRLNKPLSKKALKKMRARQK